MNYHPFFRHFRGLGDAGAEWHHRFSFLCALLKSSPGVSRTGHIHTLSGCFGSTAGKILLYCPRISVVLIFHGTCTQWPAPQVCYSPNSDELIMLVTLLQPQGNLENVSEEKGILLTNNRMTYTKHAAKFEALCRKRIKIHIF